MTEATTPDHMLRMLREVVVSMVRSDGPDLTARQFGVFLTIYRADRPQTVRGLARELNVGKAAISRAVDGLAEANLAKRIDDPADRRSILIDRTAEGSDFLLSLRSAMVEAREVVRSHNLTLVTNDA